LTGGISAEAPGGRSTSCHRTWGPLHEPVSGDLRLSAACRTPGSAADEQTSVVCGSSDAEKRPV